MAEETQSVLAPFLKKNNLVERPNINRNQSLDFFRGFVIVALIWDYFACEFTVMGDWCGPSNYFIGWEQIVMPMFYIAVGYSMQLTLKKKLEQEGSFAACLKQFKRSSTLFIFGLLSPGFIYGGFTGFDCYHKNECDNSVQANPSLYITKWFGYQNMDLYQTLPIIAVAQVLALPAMGRSFSVRLVYCIILSVIYSFCHANFWFGQVWEHVNGGSFGTLGQAVTFLMGSFLHDFYLLATDPDKTNVTTKTYIFLLGLAGSLLIIIGVLLSSLPQNYGSICFDGTNREERPCLDHGIISIPFVRPHNPLMSTWTISARSLSLPYILFTCGWSYLVYLICFLVSQYTSFQSNLINDFSTRCFLMYFAVSVIDGVREQWFPKDSPGWMVPISLVVGCFFVYLSLNFFKEQNINVKF